MFDFIHTIFEIMKEVFEVFFSPNDDSWIDRSGES